jgi:hypothetical protein
LTAERKERRKRERKWGDLSDVLKNAEERAQKFDNETGVRQVKKGNNKTKIKDLYVDGK